MGVYDADLGRVYSSNSGCVAFCAGCGVEMLKKQMVTVLIKRTRYSTPKVAFHLCEDCYAELCDEYVSEE